VVGTVKSTGGDSFTATDRTGETVTVDEQSSTTYYNARTSATSSIVTTGSRVLVRGTRNGNTVTATSVIVLPTGGFGPGSSASG
jgi:phosphoribosylamine-glycine ligase